MSDDVRSGQRRDRKTTINIFLFSVSRSVVRFFTKTSLTLLRVVLRPWPSGNILEAGRATPASLASAELEPLVSPPDASTVSPEVCTTSSPSLGPEALPSVHRSRPYTLSHASGGVEGHIRGRSPHRMPPGGFAVARHRRSESQLAVASPRVHQRRSPSPAASEISVADGRAETISGPPPSYSQTLLDNQLPSYEAACGECEGEKREGEG